MAIDSLRNQYESGKERKSLQAFRTIGAREVLNPEVLQRRLLLCLYGLGTNAGLKRMCSGGSEDSYPDLQYIRRRYIMARAESSPAISSRTRSF